MSEQLIIKGKTKDELYSNLLSQIKSSVENESVVIPDVDKFPGFDEVDEIWLGKIAMLLEQNLS